MRRRFFNPSNGDAMRRHYFLGSAKRFLKTVVWWGVG